MNQMTNEFKNKVYGWSQLTSLKSLLIIENA